MKLEFIWKIEKKAPSFADSAFAYGWYYKGYADELQ